MYNLKVLNSTLRVNYRVTEAQLRKQFSRGRKVSYPENSSEPEKTVRTKVKLKSTA